MQRAILPNLDQFVMQDAENVYEPSDDTFLLCDAINLDKDFIFAMIHGSTEQNQTLSNIPTVLEVSIRNIMVQVGIILI